jgi:hypothetical protein
VRASWNLDEDGSTHAGKGPPQYRAVRQLFLTTPNMRVNGYVAAIGRRLPMREFDHNALLEGPLGPRRPSSLTPWPLFDKRMPRR